ncbi:hypothetical protein HUU42_06690 [bacterium]|nr:hypothetical protein [bacterium]
MKKITRVDFLKMCVALLTMTGLGKWVMACSGGSGGDEDPDNGGGPTPQPDCLNAGTNVSIAGNHGHVLVVSKADVAAGTQKSYDIEGSSGHSHTVTLTTTHFASLASNQSVVVTATGGPHTHSVTVSCKSA